MWVVGTLCAAFVLLLVIWLNVPRAAWNFYRQWKAVRHIPGWPTHWFIYGNLHQLRPDQATMLAYRKSIAEHGWKISREWFGPFMVALAIHHPEPLKKVLKSPKADSVYDLLRPWLGEGLLIARGEKWHRNRHLLTPAFHFTILKSYVSVYNGCMETLLEKWATSAVRKEPVKLFNSLSLLSLDIILQCSFSYESKCQDSGMQVEYVRAVSDLSISTTERFYNPLYHINWLYWLTPHGRRTKRLCKFVHDHAEMVIRERKKALGLDKGKKETDASVLLEQVSRSRKLDFLDILLTAVDEEGIGLTDLEIRNEVDTFMFEGHDTTTSGMCWTLYCLAKYPEHQEKVREEVRSVLMGRQQLEYDDLKELKYTQWCIKEAMRLYAPVDSILREVEEDMEIDGHWIPKGMIVDIPIHTIHHNPQVWPDPERFDPLRFNPSNAKGREPYAYMAFSAGYRNCIGQNFALNEEKTVVSSLVHRFKLILDENHEVEWVPRLILRAVNDIRLRLEPLLQ